MEGSDAVRVVSFSTEKKCASLVEKRFENKNYLRSLDQVNAVITLILCAVNNQFSSIKGDVFITLRIALNMLYVHLYSACSLQEMS